MEAAASESITGAIYPFSFYLLSFRYCKYNNVFYNIVLEHIQILLTISKLDTI